VLAQLERLGIVLGGATELTQGEVVVAHCSISHGKIRVEFKGALVVKKSCYGALFPAGLYAQAVRLQGFERRSGGLFQRNIELLHRG
jgi:hypothetical protein